MIMITRTVRSLINMYLNGLRNSDMQRYKYPWYLLKWTNILHIQLEQLKDSRHEIATRSVTLSASDVQLPILRNRFTEDFELQVTAYFSHEKADLSIAEKWKIILNRGTLTFWVTPSLVWRLSKGKTKENKRLKTATTNKNKRIKLLSLLAYTSLLSYQNPWFREPLIMVLKFEDNRTNDNQ